jgi:hypothetical protein
MSLLVPKENGWEPFCLANPRQNEEQDFHYTVDSARGEGFLELVEAGPVEVYRGDYAKAPVVTKSSDVVKNLLEKIKNKSESTVPSGTMRRRHGRRGARPEPGVLGNPRIECR